MSDDDTSKEESNSPTQTEKPKELKHEIRSKFFYKALTLALTNPNTINEKVIIHNPNNEPTIIPITEIEEPSEQNHFVNYVTELINKNKKIKDIKSAVDSLSKGVYKDELDTQEIYHEHFEYGKSRPKLLSSTEENKEVNFINKFPKCSFKTSFTCPKVKDQISELIEMTDKRIGIGTQNGKIIILKIDYTNQTYSRIANKLTKEQKPICSLCEISNNTIASASLGINQITVWFISDKKLERVQNIDIENCYFKYIVKLSKDQICSFDYKGQIIVYKQNPLYKQLFTLRGRVQYIGSILQLKDKEILVTAEISVPIKSYYNFYCYFYKSTEEIKNEQNIFIDAPQYDTLKLRTLTSNLIFWNLKKRKCEYMLDGIGVMSNKSMIQINKNELLVGDYDFLYLVNHNEYLIIRKVQVDVNVYLYNESSLTIKNDNIILWNINGRIFVIDENKGEIVKVSEDKDITNGIILVPHREKYLMTNTISNKLCFLNLDNI